MKGLLLMWLRLATGAWIPTSARVEDGSIFGGVDNGCFLPSSAFGIHYYSSLGDFHGSTIIFDYQSAPTAASLAQGGRGSGHAAPGCSCRGGVGVLGGHGESLAASSISIPAAREAAVLARPRPGPVQSEPGTKPGRARVSSDSSSPQQVQFCRSQLLPYTMHLWFLWRSRANTASHMTREPRERPTVHWTMFADAPEAGSS
ncbi:uncharacterized protein LOC116081113 [Mastomys coucha]|uniref:uncharacterized protein LOC116081113 n=1 Tax=Mastomys coucha TaxID=35658 RepID=UPI001261E881|nr:uncharacterized protein LOC116081113 [Mastomys coucha]